MYVHVHVYVCVCMHTYECMSVCVDVRMCICMYVCSLTIQEPTSPANPPTMCTAPLPAKSMNPTECSSELHAVCMERELSLDIWGGKGGGHIQQACKPSPQLLPFHPISSILLLPPLHVLRLPSLLLSLSPSLPPSLPSPVLSSPFPSLFTSVHLTTPPPSLLPSPLRALTHAWITYAYVYG